MRKRQNAIEYGRKTVPSVKSTGFTLIELVVALGMAMLLAATVPVAISKLQESTEYRSTVRQILAGLKGARVDAARSGHSVPFTVNLEQRSFGVGDRLNERIPPSLDIRLILAEREMSVGDGLGMIRFYPDGSATGGTIELRRASGGGVRLRVDWLLGRISQEVLRES